MLSIRQLFFLITVITAALIPIASWSKDDLIPYTASGSCQAKPPNDFFCVTDDVLTPAQNRVVIVNIIFFCQGSTAASFALVNTLGPEAVISGQLQRASESFSYEYPMIASPGFPTGFNSVSNNPTTLIHLGPSSTYTVDFAFPVPVTSVTNCRFTASGEQFPSQH